MNIFLQSYESRLQSWYDFRQQIQHLSLEKKCISIDAYWQQVPFVAHYLHPDFIHEWPGPWDLLYINNYCYYARALGMIYTFLLLGITDIELVEAKDDNNEDVVLVLADKAKYVLNYWPDSVVNIRLQDFKISRRLDITPLIDKIGKS